VSAIQNQNGISGPVGGIVAGTYGDLTINPDGSYSYVANKAGFLVLGDSVAETFTYTITDGLGGSSSAELVITVNGTHNDAPVVSLVASTYPDTLPVENSIVGTFTFSDAEDDYNQVPIAVAIDPNSAGSTFFTIGSTGPNAGQVLLNKAGADYLAANPLAPLPPIVLVATDSGGLTGVDSAAPVLPGNQAPVAVNDSLATPEDASLIITTADLFGNDGTGDINDSDINGGTFAGIKISSLGLNGKLQLNGIDVSANQFIATADIEAGKLVFIPNTNFNGSANFVYQVSDGTFFSNNATVSIAVGALNDAPVAINDVIFGQEDAALGITASALFGADGTGFTNDYDIDQDYPA
jgi:VCBS repeat-containing protein